MAIGTTARANELLVFISSYQAGRGGISPTLREMQAAMGLASRSSAHRLLTQLEGRGRIRRLRHRARAITVLQRPSVPVLDMTDRTKFSHAIWDDGEKRIVPLEVKRNPA